MTPRRPVSAPLPRRFVLNAVSRTSAQHPLRLASLVDGRLKCSDESDALQGPGVDVSPKDRFWDWPGRLKLPAQLRQAVRTGLG